MIDTKQLRQKILDLAIRGKLVPQDPNDEPASVLLERIKAEKERLVAEGKIKRSKKSAKVSDKPHYENVPFEIPESWEWVKLGELCQIVGRIGFRGYTKKDLVDFNGAITLSPSNIVDGKMNFSKCTYISWEKYDESPEIQIQNGDILLVKTGSSFGKCALVMDLPQKATINPQFVTLKYIGCDNLYLTYVLQSRYSRTQYDGFVMGTAIPTFTQWDLNNMIVPLPPFAEQKRIVKEIERWFALIDDLEISKSDLLKYLKQTKSKILDLAIHGKLVPQDPNDEPAIELLKRINPKFTPCDTSHYANIPLNWCVCTLKDIFEITMGSSPNGSKLNQDNDGIEFHQGKICFTDKYLAKSETHTNSPIKFGKANSILLCVRAPVGVVNITPRHICIGRGLCALYPKRKIDLMFTFYTMQTYQGRFNDKATGTTFKAIGGDTIRNEIFLLPPYKEQVRIRERLEIIFSNLDAISAEL